MKIVIIGAGPAGEAAVKTLRRLAQQPMDITVIEKEDVGGLCLNKGCVPSKTLLEHVHKRSSAGLPITWVDIQAAKEKVVTEIRSQLETVFKNLKVNLIRGVASFQNEQTVEISSTKGNLPIPFDKAIIATGTEAVFPPPFDKYRKELLDSDRILETYKTPRSLAVIGGGAVGCEFACLMRAAGAQVTLIELTDGLLPGEDAAVVSALTRSFDARGIAVKTGTRVTELRKTGEEWELTLSPGGEIRAEKVLVCVGRSSNLSALDIEKAGVKLYNGKPVLTEPFQTTNPNIYVIGDAGTTRLAHAAASQGEAAACHLLGIDHTYDDRFVPRCLYSWPEVASVGRWRYELEKENKPVKASRAFFLGSAKALASADTEGFVQIVSDPGTGQILGAQIIGPHATELIHIFSVALKKEMTTRELGEVIFAHPTLSEVVREAARK